MTRREEKKLLEEFERYSEQLQRLEQGQAVSETDTDKAKRIVKLQKNYDTFVDYYFQHIHRGTKSAKFHLQAARKIKKEKEIRAVFEWARGHAKSSHMTLMIPLWLKTMSEIKTVIIVSKSENDAKRLLAKIQANLEHNQRYIADFGEQLNMGSWTDGEFTTKDGVKFIALGRGQSPRGISSEDSFRPDYVVIDDIDDDELVENPKRVRKVLDWIKSALFGALDMGRGRFILVGNRIHKDSVLANMTKLKGVYHTIINALDKRGEVSWKEKYSKEEIQNACDFVGYRASQKEYFNNPIQEGTVFRNEWITYAKIPRLTEFEAIVSYCDPSFKSSTRADYKAISTIGKHRTKIYLIEAFVRQCSINAMIHYFYELASRMPETTNYMMEANFMQDMILDEFSEVGLQYGWQLPITGDYRKKPDKFQRIEAISPYFERGILLWNEKHKNTLDFEKALEQLLAIEKGSRTADDFPDSLEGGIYILNQMSSLQTGVIRLGQREPPRQSY